MQRCPVQRRAAWLFLGTLAAAAPPASPADIADHLARLAVMSPDMQKKGLQVPKECTEETTQTFWKVLAGIHGEQEYGHKLRGEASLGFKGDDARPYGGPAGNPASAEQPEKDEYNVTAGLGLKRGVYPGEFKFNADVDVRVKGGEFQQNVRDLFVAYDHWMKPWFEGFVFGSQFSDNYMEIGQRYEVGAGAFVGPYFGPTRKGPKTLPLLSSDLAQPCVNERCRDSSDPARKKTCEKREKEDCTRGLVTGWKKELAEAEKQMKEELAEAEKQKESPDRKGDGSLKPTARGPSWLRCYAAVLGNDSDAAVKELGALLGDIDGDPWADALNAQKQRSKVFRAGVAFSVFAELEHAALKSTPSVAGTGSGTTPEDVPTPATQRYRWAVRPTFECWPSSRWSFRGDWYFKLPFGDWKTTVPGEAEPRKDYRYDLDVAAEFTVKEEEIGQPGNVSVRLRYRRIFDNVPPFKEPGGESAAPLVIAPDTHTRITMDFGIKW